MIAPNKATEVARKPSKGRSVAPFYVAVDRQLKSGHDTYAAAEQAALAIKKRYPRLQVTVYEAETRRHTIVEQPKPTTVPNKKAVLPPTRDALAGWHVSVAGARH
jgi:hypothetical protein